MSTDTRDLLLRQFRTASALLHHHLDTLTTEECLWRPSARGLHVHRCAAGHWIADWPDHEGFDLGPPSAAWTSWHIGYWWSTVIDQSFGDGILSRHEIYWPGDGPSTASWISGLEHRWLTALDDLDDAAFASHDLTKWPYRDRPFSDLVGWVTVELTKNAAELGMARFLYAVQSA